MQVSRARTYLPYLYHLSPLANACTEGRDTPSGNAVIEGMRCTYLERNDECVVSLLERHEFLPHARWPKTPSWSNPRYLRLTEQFLT